MLLISICTHRLWSSHQCYALWAISSAARSVKISDRRRAAWCGDGRPEL